MSKDPVDPRGPLGRAWDKFNLWLYTWVFVWMLVLFQSLVRRRKMSHNNGVAARGKLKIVDDVNLPENEFFTAGREFPCRLRHASAAYMDDAMLLVRAASIKFSDEPVKSPLDIEMNTGRSLFWNVWNFWKFFLNQREKKGVQYTWYYQRFPAGQQAAQDSICRNPSSYAKLCYTSQCPFAFNANDGVKRYCQFRMIPLDREYEMLVNSRDDVGFFMGDQRIEDGETRNRNYLKHEYKDRLAKAPVKYLLQIQLHDATDQDDPDLFNSNIPWDEASHPWRDLAELTIESPLTYEEEMMMYYSLNNHPKEVSLIEPKSIRDFNSINYMRAKADIAKKARLWIYKYRGMPGPLPDEGPRNVTEVTCEATPSLKVPEEKK